VFGLDCVWIEIDKTSDVCVRVCVSVQFLSKQNFMDYSLLVGIHDCDLAASADGATGDQRNNSFDNDLEDADVEDDQEDEDSPGGGGGGTAAAGDLTPPDSPVVLYQAPFFTGELDKSLEFFAVKCSESKLC